LQKIKAYNPHRYLPFSNNRRAAMISSPGEARLLLNKWMSDKSRVLAFIKTGPVICRLEGLISRTDDTDEGAVLFRSEEDFIIFHLGCAVGYGESLEMPEHFEDAETEDCKKWKSGLTLTYPEGVALIFCTMED
jgi:hypothetical protein